MVFHADRDEPTIADHGDAFGVPNIVGVAVCAQHSKWLERPDGKATLDLLDSHSTDILRRAGRQVYKKKAVQIRRRGAFIASREQQFNTLTAYFKRVNKTPKAAQNALDRYGTKTYLGFSTVRGQLGFCQTGSNIARTAIYVPRGGFTIFAIERLRELRNSLLVAGEQQFRFAIPRVNVPLPYFEDKCWDKRGNYKTKCGVQG